MQNLLAKKKFRVLITLPANKAKPVKPQAVIHLYSNPELNMLNFKATSHLIIYGSIILCCTIQVNAQQSIHFDNGIIIGAAINYGGIYFESDGEILNDIWESSFGYQFQVVYCYNISPVISLTAGLELFVNRYKFVEQRSPETNVLGEPTGNFFTTSMKDEVGTTYLTLPLNLIIRPIQNKSFYAIIGPDISFRVAHKNGTANSYFVTDSGQDKELWFEETYDIPERSRNTLIFANVGLGYSLDSKLLPLNIELRAKNSITPYMDGDNFIKSWIRNVSFSLSYRI